MPGAWIYQCGLLPFAELMMVAGAGYPELYRSPVPALSRVNPLPQVQRSPQELW
ncbi:hypothetical protein RK21_00255 [Pseudomonas plecoglossicida]|nr:hypothetical protein RK21_00255 [Pseudomonas plecoglossicida]